MIARFVDWCMSGVFYIVIVLGIIWAAQFISEVWKAF